MIKEQNLVHNYSVNTKTYCSGITAWGTQGQHNLYAYDLHFISYVSNLLHKVPKHSKKDILWDTLTHGTDESRLNNKINQILAKYLA